VVSESRKSRKNIKKEKEKAERRISKENNIKKSKTEHEKFCLNKEGPPSKLKYDTHDR